MTIHIWNLTKYATNMKGGNEKDKKIWFQQLNLSYLKPTYSETLFIMKHIFISPYFSRSVYLTFFSFQIISS